MHDLPLSQTPFAFLDVETTGLRPRFGDRVCEVAVVRCIGDVEVARFTSLVDPCRALSPGAAAVNNLTDAQLRGQPTFATLVPHLLPLLHDTVIVAHNAPFDMSFVNAELADAGYAPLTNLTIDTLELARACYTLRSHSLASLAWRLRLPVDGAHRALADALTTRGLLNHLIRDLAAQRLSDLRPAQAGFTAAAAALPAPVQQALQEGRRLVVRYQSAEGVTERLIEPLSVTARQRSVYLVAYCHLRQERRTFRLDRILTMHLEGDSSGA